MPDAWPIHTLVLDLDDTLIAERDYVASGFRAVDSWVQRQFHTQGFYEVAWRLFERGCRGTVFDDALVTCGLCASSDLVRRMVEVYRDHTPELQLLPDARGLLEWAKGQLPIALISDGYLRAQQLKVTTLELGRWISPIILTDLWGREFWKPSSRAFEALMQEIAGPASGFIYIADNPRKDFLAPRRLGWRTARIRRAGGEHSHYAPTIEESAEMEISSLTEIVAGIVPTKRDCPSWHARAKATLQNT